MKKDLQSYKEHDKDYQSVFDLENSKKRITEYENTNLFETLGFKDVSRDVSKYIDYHVDIGCGTGWLLLKTAPYFKKITGIDPSINAINIATEITKEFPHIEYQNKDMIDGIESLTVKEPVFITTAVVLSHIKDYYVKEFLKILNTLPKGSVLFFDEPYGTNIQQNMWHVRSKKWWADNLEEWDLTFKDHSGLYTHGIYGVKVGKENRINLYTMSIKENILWFIEGIKNKIKRIIRGIKRIL
jgi:SAM-dependent methyltransferase